MAEWKAKEALKTHIDLWFGHKKRLTAQLIVQINGPGIRLQISNDSLGVFDGTHMWAAPNDSSIDAFTLKTWAYFLKAPYKLNDPGTHIDTICTAQMSGKADKTAKMSFDAGTGDSPDDWYVLYRNETTNRLDALAYIVTYGGKTVAEAAQNPHAISYDRFKMIAGIPIATQWKFWTWGASRGFSKQPIGHATLRNLQFIPSDHLFDKPAGSDQISAPSAKK